MSASRFRFGAWSNRENRENRENWKNRELHPAGDELVCLLDGAATSTLVFTAGAGTQHRPA